MDRYQLNVLAELSYAEQIQKLQNENRRLNTIIDLKAKKSRTISKLKKLIETIHQNTNADCTSCLRNELLIDQAIPVIMEKDRE